jgi:hypothetical protein
MQQVNDLQSVMAVAWNCNFRAFSSVSHYFSRAYREARLYSANHIKTASQFTFLSGNLRALLNKISSSNKNTWRRHFFPFPCQTRNSFCRSSRPCSLTFTCWGTEHQKRQHQNVLWVENTLSNILIAELGASTSSIPKPNTGRQSNSQRQNSPFLAPQPNVGLGLYYHPHS